MDLQYAQKFSNSTTLCLKEKFKFIPQLQWASLKMGELGVHYLERGCSLIVPIHDSSIDSKSHERKFILLIGLRPWIRTWRVWINQISWVHYLCGYWGRKYSSSQSQFLSCVSGFMRDRSKSKSAQVAILVAQYWIFLTVLKPSIST